MKRSSKINFSSFISPLAFSLVICLVTPFLRAEDAPANKVGFSWSKDTFDQGFDPWEQLATSASHRFSFGSVIARVTRGWRFGETGTQYEIDAYPHLRDGTYLYLNVGQSSDDIFAQRRYGFEIYQSLPESWEASLGFRNLIFSKSNVTIDTASLGKYWGNYYFLFRLYVTPDEAGTSTSGSFQVRRYFGDEDYLALALGMGKSYTLLSPDSPVVILNSRKVSIEYDRNISGLWSGSVGFAIEDEEIRSDVYRRDTAYSLGLEKKF